ncbi:biotin--[acetyl-CoA-carboxylase] ligase [bacterium]|nr:biotin--[acetyl-CoA-carboxylase] ligase [bacterium]
MTESPAPLEIPFESHDVLDSTSSEAQRLAATGRRAPFAVMARMQTAGRGRRGRAWSSTPGNLMMTIVVPSRIWTATPNLESAPIRVAVLIARHLQEAFGIRVTLKWPNDILFAGRKLGGVLCETSSSGATIGDLVVGIGLNITTAPGLDGPDAVSTISLMDIIGRQNSRIPELQVIAHDLAAAICNRWPELDATDLPRAFEAYAIQAGHFLVKDVTDAESEPDAGQQGLEAALAGRDAALLKGIDDAGSLILEGFKFGTMARLTSADHSWRWVYQERPQSGGAPLMVADVGNSRIKIAFWKSARDAAPALVQAFSPDEMAAVPTQEFLTRIVADARDFQVICHVVSVNADNFALLTRAAAVAGIHVLSVSKRPARLRSDYSWEEIGADRVAAMEGFLARIEPGARGSEKSIGMVVSAGTATTIDVLTFSGRHLGGVIMPGVTTALRSLHEVAPALPDLSGQAAKIGSAGVMASDTRGAILGGDIAMTAGAIQLLIESAQQSLGLSLQSSGDAVANAVNTRVAFTGGHGRAVMSGFKRLTSQRCDLEWIEALTLEGIRAMVLGG